MITPLGAQFMQHVLGGERKHQARASSRSARFCFSRSAFCSKRTPVIALGAQATMSGFEFFEQLPSPFDARCGTGGRFLVHWVDLDHPPLPIVGDIEDLLA